MRAPITILLLWLALPALAQNDTPPTGATKGVGTITIRKKVTPVPTVRDLRPMAPVPIEWFRFNVIPFCGGFYPEKVKLLGFFAEYENWERGWVRVGYKGAILKWGRYRNSFASFSAGIQPGNSAYSASMGIHRVVLRKKNPRYHPVMLSGLDLNGFSINEKFSGALRPYIALTPPIEMLGNLQAGYGYYLHFGPESPLLNDHHVFVKYLLTLQIWHRTTRFSSTRGWRID